MNTLRKNVNNLFSRAWVRDNATGTIYDTDAMLIATLTHVTANDRSGMHGKIVRTLMEDHNLESK